MPGYLTKHETVSFAHVADLQICSLLDRNQFSDPLGAAAEQGISSALWPIFGLLWPSGQQLAARLAARVVSQERILEIGCGLGLASLVGHRRGANITASDCHPLASTFLLENLRLNDMPPLPYRHGHWAQAQPLHAPGSAMDASHVNGVYDLIIGSDLLYDRDASALLAPFILSHAGAHTEVWIIDPDRGNRSTFHRHMVAHGFVLHQERLDCVASAGVPAYQGRLLVYQRGVDAPSSA